MAKVDDSLRIKHMLEAAQKATQFAKGKKRRDLDKDELFCLAMIRLIEIIGEAASRVSPATKKKHNGIPWRQISGMRNRLIHGYDQIDLDILWQTLRQDLQPLISDLHKISP